MRALPVLLTACLLLDACALTHRMHRHPATAASPNPPMQPKPQPQPQTASHDVPAAFVGEAQSSRDLDSLASWLAQDGKTWVIATASQSDQLVVFDGDSGKRLRTVGASGTGPGQFRHPAGIVAFADLVFVVERDNHRVQVLQLPDFKPFGSFGAEQLRNPTGIWLHETAPGEYEVLVSDNDPGDARIPQSDQRIKRYRVRTDGGILHARYAGAFGARKGAGALPSAGAIAGDDDSGRLAIAEGPGHPGAPVRLYTMRGRYSGKNLGAPEFRGQTTGLALYACSDSDGEWIGVDRDGGRSALLVFDRKSLSFLGAFGGKNLVDLGGITLQPASSTDFPEGVVYAISDRASIAAFDWRQVAQALSLNSDCR